MHALWGTGQTRPYTWAPWKLLTSRSVQTGTAGPTGPETAAHSSSCASVGIPPKTASSHLTCTNDYQAAGIWRAEPPGTASPATGHATQVMLCYQILAGQD